MPAHLCRSTCAATLRPVASKYRLAIRSHFSSVSSLTICFRLWTSLFVKSACSSCIKAAMACASFLGLCGAAFAACSFRADLFTDLLDLLDCLTDCVAGSADCGICLADDAGLSDVNCSLLDNFDTGFVLAMSALPTISGLTAMSRPCKTLKRG